METESDHLKVHGRKFVEPVDANGKCTPLEAFEKPMDIDDLFEKMLAHGKADCDFPIPERAKHDTAANTIPISERRLHHDASSPHLERSKTDVSAGAADITSMLKTSSRIFPHRACSMGS